MQLEPSIMINIGEDVKEIRDDEKRVKILGLNGLSKGDGDRLSLSLKGLLLLIIFFKLLVTLCINVLYLDFTVKMIFQ